MGRKLCIQLLLFPFPFVYCLFIAMLTDLRECMPLFPWSTLFPRQFFNEFVWTADLKMIEVLHQQRSTEHQSLLSLIITELVQGLPCWHTNCCLTSLTPCLQVQYKWLGKLNKAQHDFCDWILYVCVCQWWGKDVRCLWVLSYWKRL